MIKQKWAASWQNQQNDCAPSEDSDQPMHPPRLIRVRTKKAWVPSYPLSAKRRLWSDWADAQADLSLRWAHTHFVGFVMRRLKCSVCKNVDQATFTYYSVTIQSRMTSFRCIYCKDRVHDQTKMNYNRTTALALPVTKPMGLKPVW